MYETLAKKLLEARKQKTAEERAAFLAKEVVGSKFTQEIETRAVSIDKDNHTVVFVMSSASIDRHGDIIDQDTWNLKHFDKNPAFFWQHRSDGFPLGKWVDRWFESDPENEGKKRLMGKALFRVKYEDVARAFDHVVEGDLNMVSVGFIPHRIEYDENTDAFILYDCELMECSLVGIGSQRDALVDGKGNEPEKKKEHSPESVRDSLIDTTKVLDELVKEDDNIAVQSHFKARSLIHKAIRQLK